MLVQILIFLITIYSYKLPIMAHYSIATAVAILNRILQYAHIFKGIEINYYIVCAYISWVVLYKSMLIATIRIRNGGTIVAVTNACEKYNRIIIIKI